MFVGDTVLSQAAGSSVIAGSRTYSAAEGKPVAEKSAKTGTAGTTLTWLFSNLEGTVDVQTVANAAGTTTRVFRDPYGAPIGSSGVWGSGTGYMNKPVTASTGLTTVGARTYDPVLGKFLSVDPVIDTSLPQQNTGYTYSGNNPTTYMDPSGMKFVIDGFKPKPKTKPGTSAAPSNPGGTASASGQKCKVGDWSCRVKQADSEQKCGGAGRFASCRSGAGFPYDYTVKNSVVSTKSGWTAEGVMSVFQNRPKDIFPFTVKGCSTFKSGAECNLETGLDVLLKPNGTVGVTTTKTSVTFTVIENGYFDAPGSTIKFSTYEKGGMVYLRQDAVSLGSDGYVAIALDQVFGLPPASANTWALQASNLATQLELDGRPR